MAEYIDREQALMQLTGSFPEDMSLEKYISLVITRLNKLPTADVIERSKINKAIEEIRELPFVSSKTKVVDGVKVKGEWVETIYRDDVLKILERCLGE